MSGLLSTLLTFFQNYGYPALWISIFIAAAGVPLPIGLVLLAAGAFAALGDFNFVLLFALAFSALVCGDNAGYLVGRRWGSKVLDWLETSQKWNHFIPSRIIVRSRNYFQRRGGWAIFLSRFLFSALGGAVNLLAGSELYPYRYFVLSDTSGEALGAIIPLLLGYIFGASWEAVGDVLGSFSFLVLALLAVIILVIRFIKYIQRLELAKAAEVKEPVDVQSGLAGSPAVDMPARSSGNLPLL